MSKSLYFALILGFSFIGIHAQQVEADSFMVVTQFEFPVVEGVPSRQQIPLVQYTYNRDRILIRRVMFAVEDASPKLITYYHYKDKKLIGKEHINLQNELIAYTKLSYKKNQLSRIDSVGLVSAKTNHTIKRKTKNNITTEKHYMNNSLDRIIIKTYNGNNLISSKVIYKKSKELLEKETIYEFRKDLINNCNIITKKTDGSLSTLTCTYIYKDDKLSELIVKDGEQIIKKTKYSRNSFGDIRTVNNTTNNRLEFISSYLFTYNYTDLVIPERKLPSVLE